MIRLAIDSDGVLTNFVQAFNAILNEIRPGAVPAHWEPSSWSGWTEEGLVTPDEYRVAWASLRDRDNFWTTLLAYEDNVRALKEWLFLPRSDREFYILTSRMRTGHASAQWQTMKWLSDRLIAYTPVIIADHMRDKAAIADSLHFSAIIDDNIETVYDLRCAGHNAYLLDRPWNRNTTDFEDFRVRSLREFLEREGDLPVAPVIPSVASGPVTCYHN